MRKLGIIVTVVLVLVIVAAIVIPRFIDVNRYRSRIQTELEQRLNRNVSLGEMHLSLLPLAFRADSAAIGEDKSFPTGRPFATAGELYVTAKLGPLLRKDVQISSIELKRPQIEFVRNSSGTWNFASIGNRTVNGATTPPKDQSKPANQQNFSLTELKITDGTVAITDLQKHQTRSVYDHIDLELNDFAQGKPFTLTLAAHLPGQGKQLVELKGKGGPIDDASLMNTNFDGTLKLQEVALSAAQKFLNSESLANTEAIITGSATVKNTGGKLASSGSLKLDNPVIHGVNIGYPITADYDVADDVDNSLLQITKATLKLGNTPLSITGSVNSKPTPALMDVKLQASNVSIAEAARLAAAFGVAFNPGMNVAGNMTADIHAQGATSSPTMSGLLSGSNLVVSGKDLPQPVKLNALQLQLTPEAIRSNDFTASTGGSNVNGRFTLSQYTTQSPNIDAIFKTTNANIAELIHMANAYGVEAARGLNGSGTLSLDVHAVGPVKNSAAMNFSGTGQIANASIKPESLTQPLNIKNAALQFTQNSVVINNLAASIGSTNATGNATLRNFQSPQVQFTLAADKLNVTELQQIIGSAPAPQTRTASLVPAAQAAPTPAAPSIITRMTGGGQLTIGTVTYDQLLLQNVRSTVTLNNGIIRLSPLTATVYNGQESGTIELDMRQPQTIYNVNLKLQGVDSNKLISAMSNLKETLYGLMAANANASFASVPTGSDIARTLNGRFSLNLHDGKLAGVDVLQQLSAIGKFQSIGRNAENFTKLSQLSGDFDIRNGVATTNNLKALIDGGTVAATGSVNLVDQGVNMQVTAVLSKTYSQQVGGNGIGGFMQTALANKNGELVLPVLVTGTFQSLHFAPDINKIAQMKLQNLLPSFGNPGQLSSGILGALGGRGNSGADGNSQGGVSGIMDAITGKQKPNQQYPQNPPATANPNQQAQPDNPASQVNDLVQGIFGGNKKKAQPPKQQPPPQTPR